METSTIAFISIIILLGFAMFIAFKPLKTKPKAININIETLYKGQNSEQAYVDYIRKLEGKLMNIWEPKDPKTRKILKDAAKNDIPIFILTAKDSMAIKALRKYMYIYMKNDCNMYMLTSINQRIEEFKQFKTDHPEMMELPD